MEPRPSGSGACMSGASLLFQDIASSRVDGRRAEEVPCAAMPCPRTGTGWAMARFDQASSGPGLQRVHYMLWCARGADDHMNVVGADVGSHQLPHSMAAHLSQGGTHTAPFFLRKDDRRLREPSTVRILPLAARRLIRGVELVGVTIHGPPDVTAEPR